MSSVRSAHRAACVVVVSVFLWCGLSLTSVALFAQAASHSGTGAIPRHVAASADFEPPQLLSAFFGLDNVLPLRANLICLGAWAQDGMPVVFSQSLDAATLQPADFRVVTRSGAEKVPDCALLEPADDPGESRTVLLIGQFGDWPDNPPTIVRIVDDLLSASGAVNFNGTKVSVASLDAGPYIVVAQTVPVGEWPTNTRGTLCPFGTLQVIRVTWAGGVRRPDRSEVGDAERLLYRVTVRREDGSSNAIAPFALADLGDGDNNHLLCMDTADAATAVSFPAGHLVDPNQDLNPAAYRAVVQKKN